MSGHTEPVPAHLDLSALEHRWSAETRMCFLHIPKTAGSTFASTLKQYFDLKECAPRVDPWDLNKTAGDFFSSYRYYHGHVHYDLIRKLLPGETAYVTMLREPVEQFLSDFAHRQRAGARSDAEARPNLQFDQLATKLVRMTLDEFVNSSPDFLPFVRTQTTFLGNRYKIQNFAELAASLSHQPVWNWKSLRSLFIDDTLEFKLGNAKECLASMAFFGLTERFQDSLFLLAYTFGLLPLLNDRLLNAAPSRIRREELSAANLAKITQAQWADRELYAYAQALFAARFNQMSQELLERYGERADAHLTPPLATERVAELLERHYARRFRERHRPVASLGISFDHALAGIGWYSPEQHPEHGPFRWSGPGCRSTLYLPLDSAGDKRLIFSIVAAISDEVQASLRLRVNDQPVPLRYSPGRARATVGTAYLPQALLAESPGIARLVFDVEQTVVPAGMNGNVDDRSLGIAISRVEIHPATEDDPGWAAAWHRMAAEPISELIAQPSSNAAPLTDAIRPGAGWHGVEKYQGETFCWISNNAELTIERPTGDHTRLNLEVEPGPGLNGSPLRLQVLDESGHVTAVAAEVVGRQNVEVVLPLQAGKAITFRLHVEGGGRLIPGDRRILNFRVFRFGWA